MNPRSAELETPTSQQASGSMDPLGRCYGDSANSRKTHSPVVAPHLEDSLPTTDADSSGIYDRIDGTSKG